MEKVLCYKREDLPRKWLMEMGALAISEKEFIRELQRLPIQFIPKGKAEHDSAYKQIIPYIVLMDKESRVFYYKRNGSEKRLSQLYSIGIGGHINKEQDLGNDMFSTIYNGLKRELYEETGVPYENFQSRFYGIINEERSKVGKTHLGLVYGLKIPSTGLNFRFNDEIAVNGWEALSDFTKNYQHEHWSELAIKLIQVGGQLSGK